MSTSSDPLTRDDVAFLLAHPVAHLATVDEAGRPHVVPICFAFVGSALYTPIDQKPKRTDPSRLRRVANIQRNRMVCLLVDDYDDAWIRLRWLQVRGEADLVTAAAERGPALAALRDRYPAYQQMELESRPLIRIAPATVVRWSMSQATTA